MFSLDNYYKLAKLRIPTLAYFFCLLSSIEIIYLQYIQKVNAIENDTFFVLIGMQVDRYTNMFICINCPVLL